MKPMDTHELRAAMSQPISACTITSYNITIAPLPSAQPHTLAAKENPLYEAGLMEEEPECVVVVSGRALIVA